MKGILLVDKPGGMTSHDVVDRLRKATGIRRIGHTGTLDPAATGLLILCVGKATRLSEHLTGLDKVYEGKMRLGVVTDSHDADGTVVEEREVPTLTIEEIQTACDQFAGEIEQVPPMVSAVRVGGERLYKRARKGETVERKPRRVNVRRFEVQRYEAPVAEVLVECTSGTYVRSLCHDAGAVLGCGAILASLRRTRVGRHDVADAQPLDALETADAVREHLLPMGQALDLPAVVVKAGRKSIVATGGTLSTPDLTEPCRMHEGWVQIKDDRGELLALGETEPSAMGALVHPRRVFEA
jgi:tRNA pseudouridine55 synthase